MRSVCDSRSALGAVPSCAWSSAMRSGSRPGALVVGVPLSLAIGRSLRAFLFGVTPTDPTALAGACLVLTIATLLAAYLPARRAAAVDPIVALRCE